MARYTGTVDAPHSAEEVWHYLADLRSVGEWDPSVDERRAGRRRAANRGRALRARGQVPRPQHSRSPTGSSRSIRPTGWCSRPRPTRCRSATRLASSRAGPWRQQRDLGRRPPAPRASGRVLDLPLRALFNRLGRERREGAGRAASQAGPRRTRRAGARHEALGRSEARSRSSAPASPASSPRPSCTAPATTSTCSRPAATPAATPTRSTSRRRRDRCAGRHRASSSSTSATTPTSSACWASSGSPRSRRT